MSQKLPVLPEVAQELHTSGRPSCRSCVSYVLRPCMIGVGMRDKSLIRWKTDMGCEKNMPAVQWMGPCEFFEREAGAD